MVVILCISAVEKRRTACLTNSSGKRWRARETGKPVQMTGKRAQKRNAQTVSTPVHAKRHNVPEPGMDMCEESSSAEELGVDLTIFFPLLGNSSLLKDSIHRAGWLASSTINTLVGIDIELLHLRKFWLAGGRVNTIYRTNIDT